MAVVTLENIVKNYAGMAEPAVDNVSLTINHGEFMVLLGPSGCGKSTTLRMIAGLESITSGTLSIDGEAMNKVSAKDRDIAMVFQSYALYPHMTVRDNLTFGLRRRRIPKPEIKSRVDAAALILGLDSLLERKPFSLSGGQRQRVALGRAIVRDPKVFLFDEPLSNLDAALRVRTRGELIKQHRRLGATMIYVTHDQVEAMTMGERVCIMDQGRIVQVGNPLEVYRNPANMFVASFLGSPPMNLVKGRLSGGGEGVQVVTLNSEFSVPGYTQADLSTVSGKEVVFGIRPEDIYIDTVDADVQHHTSLTVEVVTVEPLGAETLLILETQTGEEIIARVGRDTQARAGDKREAFIDLSASHIFDPKSTNVLRRTSIEK